MPRACERSRTAAAMASRLSNNLPGYAVFDAFATYTLQFEKPVMLQLNLKNIFDKTYLHFVHRLHQLCQCRRRARQCQPHGQREVLTSPVMRAG